MNMNYRLKRFASVYKRQGMKTAVKKSVEKGFYEYTLAYMNYYRYRSRYPQNVIFIAALGKSGSTWLANMCSSLTGFYTSQPLKWATTVPLEWDLYPGVFEEYRRKLSVVKGHTQASEQNISLLRKSGLRYLITVRDPRDQIVSYYYHCKNHSHHNWHEIAKACTLEGYIARLIETGEYERYWIQWIREWMKNRDQQKSYVVRYEDLLADPPRCMESILEFLQMGNAKNEINSII